MARVSPRRAPTTRRYLWAPVDADVVAELALSLGSKRPPKGFREWLERAAFCATPPKLLVRPREVRRRLTAARNGLIAARTAISSDEAGAVFATAAIGRRGREYIAALFPLTEIIDQALSEIAEDRGGRLPLSLAASVLIRPLAEAYRVGARRTPEVPKHKRDADTEDALPDRYEHRAFLDFAWRFLQSAVPNHGRGYSGLALQIQANLPGWLAANEPPASRRRLKS